MNCNSDRKRQIERLFGPDVLERVNNKNRGGLNNGKGSQYENFFAAYQIARLAKQYFEEGKETKIAGQVFAFVDDLEILTPIASHRTNYQLKSSSTISWGKGDNSLTDDFCKQLELNNASGYKSDIRLIVSDLKTADRLRHHLPTTLQGHATVEHFHYAESLSLLLQNNNDFNELVRLICARPDEADKVETVAVVLLSVWINSEARSGYPINISELIGRAKHHHPSYIRAIEEMPPLSPEVEKILNAIENFHYSIKNGFFSWEYQSGLDSGMLSYDCADPKFQRFQEFVLKQRPASFPDLEGLLLS